MDDLPEAIGPAGLGAWRPTNDQLVLSLPLLESDGWSWPTYEAEWAECEAHFLAIARQVSPREALERLTELFQRAWTAGFRSVGVQAFFEKAARERRSYVAAVLGRADASLAGRRTAQSQAARSVLDDLVADLRAHRTAIEEDVRRRTAASVAIQRRLAALNSEWSRLGARRGRRAKTLTEAAFLLREDYTARTFAVGGAFARLLITEIIAELGES
jgi:hypothetical protein